MVILKTLASIVLPAATSWEREGFRTGFDASLEAMRRVQFRPAAIKPIGEARSDTNIVLDLAKRLGLSRAMFDCDADKGHAHILAPSGAGLDELKANQAGITLTKKVQLEARWANGFATLTKRLEIYSEQMLQAGYAPIPRLDPNDLPKATDKAYLLRLGSAKIITYCHSQGRNIASLRSLGPDPILEMSPETAEQHGIAMDDWVEIFSNTGSFIARAKLVREIASNAVFAQHGWKVSDIDDSQNQAGDCLAPI